MSTIFLTCKRPEHNRGPRVRQRELYIIGLGSHLNCHHRSFREATTQAIMGGAKVQEGSLDAEIVETPREWSLCSVARHLTAAERAKVLQNAPVRKCARLRIEGSFDVEPTMFTVNHVAPNGVIPQSLLRWYLDQVPLCLDVQDIRNRVVQQLGEGASIEPGEFDAKLETFNKRHYSLDVFAELLGEARCKEIQQAIGPLRRRHLVIRDADGQPLGWHAGRNGPPWVRVPHYGNSSSATRGD